MSNGRLIIKSNETLKKLLYVLRLEINRNLIGVLNYYDNKFQNNFYTHVNDFDQFSNQLVLKGSESVYNLINSVQFDYTLYEKINLQKAEPYFFKNKNIDNDVYIAQNTDDLKKAIQISIIWNENNYNTGYNSKIEQNVNFDFILYSYINHQQIEKYYINNKDSKDYDIQIIGYKLNWKAYYTTLLKF